ncbi:hypothetical protein, partial [Bacillus hominis]|uniref:hypothetical protein n=1 Tax=Bacillus hominis TaxID=2817478 RepID=UPI001BB40FCA
IILVAFSSKKIINDTFTKIPKIFIVLIATFVLFPLIGFLKYGSYQIVLNAMLSLIYILLLMVTLNIIKEEIVYRKMIDILYYSVFVFLLLLLILNGESLININNITNAFNLDDRIRQTYGLKHANTLGNICLIFIIVGLKKKQWCIYKKEKIFILFLEAIALFVMLNSGSRTALTAS